MVDYSTIWPRKKKHFSLDTSQHCPVVAQCLAILAWQGDGGGGGGKKEREKRVPPFVSPNPQLRLLHYRSSTRNYTMHNIHPLCRMI